MAPLCAVALLVWRHQWWNPPVGSVKGPCRHRSVLLPCVAESADLVVVDTWRDLILGKTPPNDAWWKFMTRLSWALSPKPHRAWANFCFVKCLKFQFLLWAAQLLTSLLFFKVFQKKFGSFSKNPITKDFDISKHPCRHCGITLNMYGEERLFRRRRPCNFPRPSSRESKRLHLKTSTRAPLCRTEMEWRRSFNQVQITGFDLDGLWSKTVALFLFSATCFISFSYRGWLKPD